MAIERVLLSADRILITKQGFAAVAGVSDEGKVFDSAWSFTGTLLARGIIEDTATPESAGSGLTLDATPLQRAVPTPFFVRDLLILLSGAFGQVPLLRYSTQQGWTQAAEPGRDEQMIPATQYTYSNGVLSLPRVRYDSSSPARYIIRSVLYRVYSV